MNGSMAADTANTDYQGLVLDYVRSPDQDAARAVRHPVVVVGAGPVGLSAAIDLAQQGVPVVLLDDDNRLSTGSRAICFAKRTLEIFDRLGCGQRMVDKGVTWNLGKVFFHDEPVYGFNLLPEAGHQRPAFINLQQYYVEGYLFERARALPNLDIRWKHQVTGLEQTADGVSLTVATPEGEYGLRCDWLVAADGARSPIRKAHGAGKQGPHLPRPLPDRRRAHGGRLPGRALVLVRPALPPEPVRAAAPAAGRRVAHRLPARLGRRPRGRAPARPGDPARAGAARAGHALRPGVGQRLHLRLPAHGALPPRPRALRRRQRARRLALRRPRRQQRGAGRGEPGLEAAAGAGRQGAGGAARQLRRRARLRGGREHPELHPQHRLHHAQERGEPRLPRRDAGAGQGLRLRPPAGEQRPAVACRAPTGTRR